MDRRSADLSNRRFGRWRGQGFDWFRAKFHLVPPDVKRPITTNGSTNNKFGNLTTKRGASKTLASEKRGEGAPENPVHLV